MGTAKKLKDLNGGAGGIGAVFEVDPPMTYLELSDDYGEDKPKLTSFVWVSAVNVPFSGPETYIFACTKEGKVLDWLELEGSFRGALDIERALRGAGYEIIQ